jgi:hypothetical protein
MSMIDRAAQFSPFAALTGYDEAIQETGRLTEEKVYLDEDAVSALNEKIRLLQQNPGTFVAIDCFCKDPRKSGGAYRTITGHVIKVDPLYAKIQIDGSFIAFEDIYDIRSDLFAP